MKEPRDLTDPWQDPEMLAYMEHARDDLIPKLRDSAMTISLMPTTGGPDIKFATELGLSIMMDKPIVAVVLPGAEVPAALRRAAVAVIEGDMTTDEGRETLKDSILYVMSRLSEET